MKLNLHPLQLLFFWITHFHTSMCGSFTIWIHLRSSQRRSVSRDPNLSSMDISLPPSCPSTPRGFELMTHFFQANLLPTLSPLLRLRIVFVGLKIKRNSTFEDVILSIHKKLKLKQLPFPLKAAITTQLLVLGREKVKVIGG